MVGLGFFFIFRHMGGQVDFGLEGFLLARGRVGDRCSMSENRTGCMFPSPAVQASSVQSNRDITPQVAHRIPAYHTSNAPKFLLAIDQEKKAPSTRF